MDWYTILKFLHVVTATVWVGGGFLLVMVAIRAERADDREATLANMRNTGALGNVIFMPAALLTLVSGLLMCWFWVGFTDLWILVGLGGYATTFVIGAGIMKPTSDRLTAIVAQEGGLNAPALAIGRRMLQIAKFDYTVMLIVIAAMVLKPAADDFVIIGAMAGMLIAGVVLFLIPRREPALPAAA
jgi:uncharacterized membrane protein